MVKRVDCGVRWRLVYGMGDRYSIYGIEMDSFPRIKLFCLRFCHVQRCIMIASGEVLGILDFNTPERLGSNGKSRIVAPKISAGELSEYFECSGIRLNYLSSTFSTDTILLCPSGKKLILHPNIPRYSHSNLQSLCFGRAMPRNINGAISLSIMLAHRTQRPHTTLSEHRDGISILPLMLRFLRPGAEVLFILQVHRCLSHFHFTAILSLVGVGYFFIQDSSSP
jgi:hypothetical protein